ncbi:MAG TPA: HlyD family efflux transporter periplasmic adaptor subunit [Bacteroidales bacterium]|nr:HlyD family efflux transporter periplasmic adaptor subunit [Bacteroidales bacterium]
MKKNIIIVSSVFAALIALYLFNRLSSSGKGTEVFAEVMQGPFEITVSNSGELLAENSLDVMGPELFQNNMNQGQRGGGGGNMRGGGGMNVRAMELKIQDIVPEGTVVSAGDYIAQLDRSSYSNTLKDAQDQLKTYRESLDMKILDTAVVLTNLRDEIKNQRYQVEEARITLDQSKFEPPATIRQAEINLQKQERALQQKIRSYELRSFQVKREIDQQRTKYEDQMATITQLETFLSAFTVRAPSAGMVIYKKEYNGSKRKAGSNLSPFDNVVATLPDLSHMLSKVFVSEIEVSRLAKGQKVNITVDAFPQKAYTGTVTSIANIGEQLPNSDAKMFEVLIRLDGTDPTLRPAMTTTNKIIIKNFDDVIYVPTECVQAGIDSIPFVYQKHKTKQYVVIGEANDKNVIIEQGLEAGKQVYLIPPASTENFRETGKELMAVTRERNNAKRLENQRLTDASLAK